MQASRVRGRVLTANAMNAHNTFERPDQVVPGEFSGVRLRENTLIVNLPSKAVIALEVQ
jgi:alpha-N-arabinofuranosidase